MDIEEYEFADLDVEVEMHKAKNGIGFKIEYKCHVTTPNEYCYMFLTKGDVIALAKHFQLTADDIKDKE